MIRVGYQGIEGSNSETAAKKMVMQLSLTDVEFIPLVTSQDVCNYLIRGAIDYGVVAYRNNLGGVVNETKEVFTTVNYDVVMRSKLRIHHALFVKNSTVDITEIDKIISHEQALKQCEQYIDLRFPNARLIKSPDTAISAQQLKDGLFDDCTAVICKKEAGEQRGLFLLDENIEDSESITEFLFIRKSPYELTNNYDLPVAEIKKRKLLKILTSDSLCVGFSIISVLLLLFGLVIYKELCYVSLGSVIIVCLLLAFRKQLQKRRNRSCITGYWRYNSSAVSGQDINQQHDFVRIVEISENNGELVFNGWICTDVVRPLFKSIKTVMTKPQERNGSAIYWYTGSVDLKTNAAITGVAVLEWNIDDEFKQVNRINGWYLGSASKEIGTLSYTRITKNEFDYLRSSKVLIL